MKEEEKGCSEKSYMKMQTQADQIRYEFTNQDTIVLRKNGMYHKAMGNSAVMLRMLGAKTKLRSGFDPVTSQEVLEMSVHVGKIAETKLFLGQLGKEVLRDDGGFFVVRLRKSIDAKRLKREKRDAGLKTDVTEDILMQRRQNTPLAKEVRDIFKEVGLLMRTMTGTDGVVLARAILEEVMGLQKSVRVLTRGGGGGDNCRAAIDDAADNLQGMLLLVPNFVRQADRLAKIGRSLNRIRAGVAKVEDGDVKTSTGKRSSTR